MPRRSESWKELAACRGTPAEWWFPPPGEVVPVEARRRCSCCPVRSECREYGASEAAGFWGGVDHNPQPTPRQRLRRAAGR